MAMLRSVMPIQIRKRLFIDAGWYYFLTDSVLRACLPDRIFKKTVTLLVSDVLRIYPLVVLSRSLTGVTNNKDIMHLSADRQMAFRFFIACGTIH